MRNFLTRHGRMARWLALAGVLALFAAIAQFGGAVGDTAQQSGDSARRSKGAAAQFPGHTPGKICLGISSTNFDASLQAIGGKACVHRSFFQFGDWDKMQKTIAEDHAANRIPWVSYKPPGDDAAAGWRKMSSGGVDAQLKALASMLKANDDKPVILTFHHEPSNDSTEANGDTWANAWAYQHDLLAKQGALTNVADAPIIGEWLFSNANKNQDPENWVKPVVLSRAAFFGVDLYENNSGKGFDERLGAIKSWLAAHGQPNMMVGIGEMGCTDATYPKTSAVQCMNANLGWAKANTDKIGVISYFDSPMNSKEAVYWPLDESWAKRKAYTNWLNDSPTFIKEY